MIELCHLVGQHNLCLTQGDRCLYCRVDGKCDKAETQVTRVNGYATTKQSHTIQLTNEQWKALQATLRVICGSSLYNTEQTEVLAALNEQIIDSEVK